MKILNDSQSSTGSQGLHSRSAARLPRNQPHWKIILLGIIASALFSVTFIINHLVSIGGGHWAWTAALRFFFMVPLLVTWICTTKGVVFFHSVMQVMRAHLPYFLVAGSIGYGVFYSCICFASQYTDGWIVASVWQSTIIASPIVLLAFGQPLPSRSIASLAVVAAGIVVIQVSESAGRILSPHAALGSIPVLVAAFAYPVGNQMLWKLKETRTDPATSAVLADPVACVLLLTLGALPLIIGMLISTSPGIPSVRQITNTALVALIAGCIATTVFTYARNSCKTGVAVTAVDATQAGEVIWTLVGELLLSNTALPHPVSILGIVAITGGLIAFAFPRPQRP